MRRRLLMLLGFGAAAQEPTRLVTTSARACMGKGIPLCEKPANNECPKCGTVAASFKLPKPAPCHNGPVYTDNMPVYYPSGLPHCVPADEPRLLLAARNQNLARCLHCNTAFWQDAEVEK